jgi:hypothetical protein
MRRFLVDLRNHGGGPAPPNTMDVLGTRDDPQPYQNNNNGNIDFNRDEII